MIGNGFRPKDLFPHVAPHFRGAMWRMVIGFTGVVTTSAVVMCVGAHVLLDDLGLLPYPLNPAMTIGSGMAGVLAASITWLTTSYTARAYYHLEETREEFERLSRTDALTGLLNRRALVQAFADTPGVSALALFDIDHFKKINDRFGHGGGDAALVETSRVLAASFAAPDVVARIGGEEFAVLIASCPGNDATALVERARRAIGAQSITFETHTFSLNLSGGIVHADPADRIDALLLAADRALYLAKSQGRNRLIDAGGLAVLRPLPGRQRTITDDGAAQDMMAGLTGS